MATTASSPAARGSPLALDAALPVGGPRAPEVLVVCLVHNSVALRAVWPSMLAGMLSPLFYALASQHETSRLLVGGIVYCSEPDTELSSLLRPGDAFLRVPFLPAPRFVNHLTDVLHTAPKCATAQLDAADKQTRLEAALPDALAAALDQLNSRNKPTHLAPFAREALLANHSLVAARYLLHVLALEHGELPNINTALAPRLNACANFDSYTLPKLVAQLGEQNISVGTLLAVDDVPMRRRRALAQSAHNILLVSHTNDEAVAVSELLGSQWNPPPNMELLLSGGELRTLKKRSQVRAVSESPSKRMRTTADTSSPLPRDVPSKDQATMNKILLLQQQSVAMMKALARSSAKATGAQPSAHLQGQMFEQIRQQLVVQQAAIKRQAELLRSGKRSDLNVILQALVNIDKEAKEAGIYLHGPSSMLARASRQTPRPSEQSGARTVWQGILKWTTSANQFTLVVATLTGATNPQTLALPWPNVLSVSAFVPVDVARLQRIITTLRVPSVLLTVRAFPPSLAVRGAENNESHYQQLATMLERGQRAAYIPHGDPGCGLLVLALSSARMPSSSQTPRLLALVFNKPIPMAQLTQASTASANQGSNTRGMVNMPTVAPAVTMDPASMGLVNATPREPVPWTGAVAAPMKNAMVGGSLGDEGITAPMNGAMTMPMSSAIHTPISAPIGNAAGGSLGNMTSALGGINNMNTLASSVSNLSSNPLNTTMGLPSNNMLGNTLNMPTSMLSAQSQNMSPGLVPGLGTSPVVSNPSLAGLDVGFTPEQLRALGLQ